MPKALALRDFITIDDHVAGHIESQAHLLVAHGQYDHLNVLAYAYYLADSARQHQQVNRPVRSDEASGAR